MATATSPARPTSGASRRPRLQRWFSANLIRLYAVVAFAYLFVPVAYTFVFSFNDSGKSNLKWRGLRASEYVRNNGGFELARTVDDSDARQLYAATLASIRQSNHGRASSEIISTAALHRHG